MVQACASCGAPLTGEARFCASCGAAVTVAPAREARKVVTALFADVVGSTSLAERMDPEDFKSIVGTAVARMAEAVAEYGGDVSEFAGDGLLALFGAPVAHEDDPERAVLAGLRIAESAGELARDVERDWGIEGFAVRVGIETGLAVLGPVGGGERVEYGALGDSLNTAARLQAASEPGMVLVGAQTRKPIEPLFDWGEPRELSLKGKAEPVIAYPVAGPRRTRGAGRSAGAAQAPFIGREAELEGAQVAIDRALDGSGGILIVSGEAGIGKSRLVGEIRARFEAGEAAIGKPRWLEGRCVSYGEAIPYWPFRLLLREWLAGPETPPDADMGEALRAQAERLLGAAAIERAPLLEALLGIAVDPQGASPELGEETRRGIQEAAGVLFAALAGEGPLVIAIDDLHWADASSLALLRSLFDLVEDEPVLLVLASRPEREQPIWGLRELAHRELPHRTREIALEALAAESDAGLLAALVGSAELPPELERRLLARAEGNPFYLEELVSSLVDAGALVRANGGWRFDREVPVDLPETVEKVILARIDRLSGPAHELLSVAAVLGRQFPVALLEEVSGARKERREALRELQRADLIRDGGRMPAPMLIFKHTLIQESAYRSLLKRRRQELHLGALEAIESLYSDRAGEFLGMLAHHASAAGDDERALLFHGQAGDAARRLYSVEEAIDHYGAALDAAGRLELDPIDERVRAAYLHRAVLRYDSGDLEGALPDLEAALAGARSAGDRAMEVDALLSLAGLWRMLDFARAQELMEGAVEASEGVADPDGRARALGRLSILYANQLQLDRSQEIAERALAIAREEGGKRSLVVAMDALKLTALQTGDLATLEELTERLASDLRQRSEDDSYLEWVLLESAFAPLGAGRFEQALARIEEALELVRSRGRAMHEAVFVDALCWAHRSRGDYERAIECGRAASDMAHGLESNEWAAWADATLGWALLDARAGEEAIECLERGVGAAEAAGAPAQLVRCVCLLAWARSLAGDEDGAAALTARADGLLARVSAPPGRAWLYGAHAYVALARAQVALGDGEHARALVAPIVAAGEAAGWHEAVACGELVIGQAHAAAGDPEAVAAFEHALAVAEGAGLPAPAWEARASLAALSHAAGETAAASEHAARARDILSELASGLSEPALRRGLLETASALP